MLAIKIGKIELSTVTATNPLSLSAMSGTVVVPKRNVFKTNGESYGRSKRYYCIVGEDRKVRVEENRRQ